MLGLLDSQSAQPALLDRALAADTDAGVKPALFKGLATSAKFFGNRLETGRVSNLRKFVQTEQTPN